jgi:hypothetical protein
MGRIYKKREEKFYKILVKKSKWGGEGGWEPW